MHAYVIIMHTVRPPEIFLMDVEPMFSHDVHIKSEEHSIEFVSTLVATEPLGCYASLALVLTEMV
jgi:hypothetical protein